MYKRILIPTDGSACSELALKQGLRLAQTLGAEVTLLHALEDPAVLYAPQVMTYHPDLYESLKQAGQAILAEAKALADKAGVTAKTVLADRIKPAEAILKAESEVDLVVLGTHGRRGFDRFMFGSVAEAALRRATRPYLVIRDESGSDEA